MLDTAIYALNNEFIVYKPHNLPRADTALKHYCPARPLRHNWPGMDGVIRMSRVCGVCIRRGTLTRHLARLRVWGEWPQWHWHWPVVSPGSPVTARGHPSEVSRGLLMTLVMTSLIILCSHLSWPGPRVSISTDDQHCDDRCQGTAELMSRCHSLVPTPRIVTDSHRESQSPMQGQCLS